MAKEMMIITNIILSYYCCCLPNFIVVPVDISSTTFEFAAIAASAILSYASVTLAIEVSFLRVRVLASRAMI